MRGEAALARASGKGLLEEVTLEQGPEGWEGAAREELGRRCRRQAQPVQRPWGGCSQEVRGVALAERQG